MPYPVGVPFSQMVAGVSGGIPVQGLPNGVPLQLLNDYGYVLVGNLAPTPGPDTQGVIVISPGLSGGYAGSPVVAFEKCVFPADFLNNNWTPLQGVIPRASGQILSGNTYTLSANQSLDVSVPSVQGFYAIRARLSVVPASGIVVVSGTTFPVISGSPNPATLAALAQLNTMLTANVLMAIDQTGQNYIDAANAFTPGV